MVFDPTRLTTDYSMNRMPMVEVPGVTSDPAAIGKRAYDLLSTAAVNQRIWQRAEALQTPPGVKENLAPWLNQRLESTDPQIRQAAHEVAEKLGRDFGRLLAILKTGQRSARPEWGEDVWRCWAGIRRIVVGGGLSTGRLGQVIVSNAQAVVAGCLRTADFEIEQSTFGKWLTLVGTACHAPTGFAKARVYDFGGTAVKMGWAGYRDGLLESLHVSSHTQGYYDVLLGEGDEVERGTWVAEQMIDLIAADLESTVTYNGMALAVLLSMACYVHDGHPAEQLGYGLVGKAARAAGAKTLQDWLSSRLEACVGRPVTVGVYHDGTAAAGAYGIADGYGVPSAPDTAVFVLGTAIGYGFSLGEIRKLRPEFTITA